MEIGMGVDVAGGSVAAFLALILAVALIGVAVFARRRGHLQSRPLAYGLGAIVLLLVVYGMTGGFLPRT
jgi:hypothetical protein